MAKKKSKQILRPWCWYCEREFEDEKVLMQHQKAKHFKCNMCPRRLNTAGGLAVHIQQVHKLEPENLPRIENALPGRDGYEVEIFGMEGIPAPDVADYKRRKEIELGLSAGSISQPQAKRPKTENRPMTEDELRAQLEAHKALMGAADAPNPSSSGHGASGAESSSAAVMYGAPPQAYGAGAGSPMGPTPPGMMPGAPPFFPGMPPPGFPPGSSPPGAPGQMPFSPFPPGMMPPGPPPGQFGFSPPPGYPIPPPGMQLPPPGSSPNAFPLPPPPPGVRVGPSMPAPVPGQQPPGQPQPGQQQQQQPPFPGAPPFPPNGQAAPPFPPQNGQPPGAPPFPPNGQGPPPFPPNGQGAPPFPPNGQFPPGFPPFPPGGGPPPFGYPPPGFMPPNPNMPPHLQQPQQNQQQQQNMPPQNLMNTPPTMPGSTPMPPPVSGGTPGQGQGGMHFTPPPGTPMPPTPQSGTFGGQGGPYTPGGANGAPASNGAGGGQGQQGGQQGGQGAGERQTPQLVLPNPALAQTNPEMKKKTELKYVDANFSPDEVRAIHPKYYFPKGQPYTPTAAGGGYTASGAGDEPRGKKRARAEDFL